ncbi:MAG: hypothetical protein ABSB79_11695, partial [Syntrophales bacterium]
ECVFMILSPADMPDEQIIILGLAGKAARNRQFMDTFRSSSTPDEAYAAIIDWETAGGSSSI